MLDEIIIYTDGGSRGNPGPSAAAFVLTDSDGKHLDAKGLFLGNATNNIAEYTGIIKALEAAIEIGAGKVTVFSDSELLVRQLKGKYKVKSENLKPLFCRALDLLNKFQNWKVKHVAREKNKEADKLVNQALNLEKDVIAGDTDTRIAPPVKLGVLISGGGTTLMNILRIIDDGRLNAEIPLVISSRSTVAGVQKAKDAGLNVKVIRRKDYPDVDKFSKGIEDELTAANVDLVVQAGWLCLWKIPARFENRVMNIHPALLPSFGGQGMWGHHVHQAVLAAGAKVSGCTIHFCTNDYDKGPIIIQRCCPVRDDDTPETLAERVFKQECIAYPEAIRLFQQGRIRVENGRVKISP
ncbi:MAG: phosphoribosylglycinamide formyltransferase [Planctomycetota bacterium]